MIQTNINDPIEGMINADKAMRFPPWKMIKASFALVGQHFLLFLNLWAVTTLIILMAAYGALSLFLVKMNDFSTSGPAIIAYFVIAIILAASAIKALIALPIMRIVLDKTYKTCRRQKCTCVGRFWFGACTCGGRLWTMGLFSLVSTLLMGGIIRLFFAVRLIPLWGSLATPIDRPVSVAWHLSRGSWWRLFWGGFLIKILNWLTYAFIMAPLLNFLLPIIKAGPAHHLGGGTIDPIIAPIVLFQMPLMVCAGLAFRFLYETRLQGEGSETTPSQKPVQTLKTGSKGRNKTTRSNKP